MKRPSSSNAESGVDSIFVILPDIFDNVIGLTEHMKFSFRDLCTKETFDPSVPDEVFYILGMNTLLNILAFDELFCMGSSLMDNMKPI